MNLLNNIIVLITIAFFAIFFYQRVRRGYRVDLANLLLIIWLGSSIASLIFLHADFRMYNHLSVFPACFFCLSFFITIIPFLKKTSQEIDKIIANNEIIEILCMVYFILIIIPGFEIVTQSIPKLSSGMDIAESMADIHDDRQAGEIVEVVKMSFLGSLCWRFISFSTILPVFLLFYLSLNWKSLYSNQIYKFLALTGLLSVLIVQNLFYFVNSQRSMISRIVIIAMGCFVLFYYQYNKIRRRKIMKYMSFIGGMIIFAIGFITFARFTTANDRSTAFHDRTIVDWTSLYIGEGLLNFNEYVWNMRGTTEGDVGFLYYKNLLGYDRVKDDYHRRQYWSSRTGIPQHIFYTYIGVFVEDFTPIGALFIFSLISYLLCGKIKIRNGTIAIHDAYLLIILFYVIANGYSYYAFGGLNKGARLWHELLICAFWAWSITQIKSIKLHK